MVLPLAPLWLLAATTALAETGSNETNASDANATEPEAGAEDGEGRLIRGNFCMATTACTNTIQPRDRSLGQYYCGIVDGFLHQCYAVDRCDDCSPHYTAKDVGCLTAYAKNKCASVLAENLWFMGYEHAHGARHYHAAGAGVLLALGAWHG
jgi:hypothetical protein